MNMTKKGKWIAWVAAGICVPVLAWAAIWNPFARPDLEQSAIVLLPPANVASPADDGDVLTVLYSGDGGWADLDKQLGTVFAARGIPVLGINSFKYFWRARSREVAAEQLDALITKYLTEWHKHRVWLVGFSFGADALPSIIDRLSPDVRARIAQLVLLSPSHNITFEIQFQGYMIGQGRIKAFLTRVTGLFNKVPEYPALPPVVALDNRFPVACYYGLDDRDDTLCTEAGLPAWVTVYGMPGGHHFDEGYQRLATQLIDRLPAAGGPAPAASVAAQPAAG
ncbi:MAG TPA: AcvB/VirJ family lysyl-phosphatidylglycerol hydrolase [Rhodanobacteraceae bacterium]|nr:AcvB/VirJ family lysyl-phosphatidylglycerol hydrolase [Rhodanobacteraceae bacterium]